MAQRKWSKNLASHYPADHYLAFTIMLWCSVLLESMALHSEAMR